MTDNQDMLQMTVRDFASAVAAKTPTPGGGSVAGVVGALATALGEMTLNFTRGKKKYAQHENYHVHLASRLEKARRMFQDLVADDVAAYGFYQEQARRDDSDPQKAEAVQLALAAAISVPKEMGKLALALLEDLRELEGRCNPWLISDLVAGAALAVATVSLCDFNVRINVPNLTDKAAAADLHKGSASDLARALALQAEINEAAKQHLP